MISIGNRCKVIRDIQHANGMLYKGTKVRIKEQSDGNVQVSDEAGRLFWIKSTDISV